MNKILPFDEVSHFQVCLTNPIQLAAFALGAQLPEIRRLLSVEGYLGVPSSLMTQDAIEDVAKRYEQIYRQYLRLNEALHNHSSIIVKGSSLMLEDIDLHLTYPGLALAKYYAALKSPEQTGHIIDVWLRHLKVCRALCLAISEQYRVPKAKIAYRHNAVLCQDEEKVECVCYSETKVPLQFHVERWKYYQYPFPWVVTTA